MKISSKKEKQPASEKEESYILLQKPKSATDDEAFINSEDEPSERIYAATNLLGQVCSYLEKEKLLGRDTLEDIRYLIEDYLCYH